MKQPRPQGLLGVQNGGSEKTLAAGHVSPKILEILIVSNWKQALWFANLRWRDLLLARVFSKLAAILNKRRPWGWGWFRKVKKSKGVTGKSSFKWWVSVVKFLFVYHWLYHLVLCIVTAILTMISYEVRSINALKCYCKQHFKALATGCDVSSCVWLLLRSTVYKQRSNVTITLDGLVNVWPSVRSSFNNLSISLKIVFIDSYNCVQRWVYLLSHEKSESRTKNVTKELTLHKIWYVQGIINIHISLFTYGQMNGYLNGIARPTQFLGKVKKKFQMHRLTSKVLIFN